MTKTVIITGSSSGIGEATAQHFLEQGWKVLATARDTSKISIDHPNVSKYTLDVTSSKSIKKAQEAILKDHPQIDALVNNAGYNLVGAVETLTQEQLKQQFQTNIFGVIELIQAFLPTFKQQKDGVIVNVSSVGGRVTFPFHSSYHATKFALEGFTQSLYFELKPLGIKVRLIEPGAVNTNFLNSTQFGSKKEEFPEYMPSMEKLMNNFQKKSFGSSTKEDVAKAIYKATVNPSFEKIQYPVGKDAKIMLMAKKWAPEKSFRLGTGKSLLK